MKLFLIVVLGLFSLSINSQLTIDTSYTTNRLINEFFVDTNKGISIYDINFLGADQAVGAFKTELKYNKLFKEGIILSTGSVFNAVGPNESINTTAQNNKPGYYLLDDLASGMSFDASVLSFKFIPLTDRISFNFIFASEEYPEYVNKGVNDVFGFFIKDISDNKIQNIAVLPDNHDPITVDYVNKDKNNEYYISVPVWDKSNVLQWEDDKVNGEMAYLFQFDGLTVPITIESQLIPYQKYEFIVAIADVGDQVYDSWVMLEANSFVSNGEVTNPGPDDFISLLKKKSKLAKMDILEESGQVSVMSSISFELNSHEIKPDSYALLNEIIGVMKYSEFILLVNGFTDDIGTDNYNLELSQRRADSVRKYLLDNGIENKRVIAEGKGELKNWEGQDIDDSRSKNRKVEFVFKYQ